MTKKAKCLSLHLIMTKPMITDLYKETEHFKKFESALTSDAAHIRLKGLAGSALAVYYATHIKVSRECNLIIMDNKETASYFFNDLENIFGETDADIEKKHILFFPNSHKTLNTLSEKDSLNELSRLEVLSRLSNSSRQVTIVTYPEAVAEKSVTPQVIKKNGFNIRTSQSLSFDELSDYLQDNGYERVDFVLEPGQFSIRGGIFDVYSFNNEYPYRIEFFGDSIESLRSFNPVDQLSVKSHKNITIIPAFDDDIDRKSLIEVLPPSSRILISDPDLVFSHIEDYCNNIGNDEAINQDDFANSLLKYKIAVTGLNSTLSIDTQFDFDTQPQPEFNKNSEMLVNYLEDETIAGKTIYICSETASQTKRIQNIIDELVKQSDNNIIIEAKFMELSLTGGFIDNNTLITFLTDHQIFERYYKYQIKDRFNRRQAATIKELTSLNPGDYVTHIDYGIGRFEGLQKIVNGGKEQEAIRISYANNDLLYVNIHSLYKISKYSGSEGHTPKLNRLGSSAWATLKNNTKKKVKDIAKELINLYAERKANPGFAFSPDTYLQHELEASFMYEDTPDQVKATNDVKADMEKPYPMERLICGDVGFGKTEIAIRAAFKAVSDSKQVAVLVPTTILALQHYNTFKSRLKDFPANVEYINRFRTTKQQTEIWNNVENGKIDILIGTHILLGKKAKFKNLGLLIIDEEQKFGVSAKEKLKKMKVNVDTLTLTATPIPRTLQFSLMGARDLSILQTPPPNRQPVQTEVCQFDENIIRNAIEFELNRGGQVFFVHNKIKTIELVKDMILKIMPGISIAVGHGQMDGNELEQIMIDFIDGKYDILLCTTIIESGLDIPNVNTIIINDAQNYGLSELHQLRGRVGRTNKKAFCYLISPPFQTLTEEASKRLRAIEEFSDLGSGFNIALRDLDIRGAGDILGAEQSGFISDIGFDMYQKILNEAMSELKLEENIQTANSELIDASFAKDCQIDTDIEALIPDEYISSLSERMLTYRKMNEVKNDEEFAMIQSELTDRFGPIPKEVKTLFNVLKVKNIARNLGIEKILFKGEILKFYFLPTENTAFYQSATCNKIFKYVQQTHRITKIGEKNGRMTLQFEYDKAHPYDFHDVLTIINEITVTEA